MRPRDRMLRDTPLQRIAAALADLIEAWTLDEMELWGRLETPDGPAEIDRIELPHAERRKVTIMFRQNRLRHLPSGRTWCEVHTDYTSPAAAEKWKPDHEREKERPENPK